MGTPTHAYETRAEATHLQLKKRLEEHLKTVEGGEWDGIQVVTNADLLEVFGEGLPEPNERAAEVTTPARISVLGLCPSCGQGSYLAVHINPVLTVDGNGRSLKLTAKSKAVNHICGQIALPQVVAPAGQEECGLEDIVRPEDALTDEERKADEGPLLEDAMATGLVEDAERDRSEAAAWDPATPPVPDDDGDLLPE